MGDLWRTKPTASSSRASSGADGRKATSSSNFDVSLSLTDFCSVGRGITFGCQDESRAHSARPASEERRKTVMLESEEFFDSQYAVEELEAVVMNQESDLVPVDDEEVHKAWGREEPLAQVRPREPNVVVVPRPADRF